MDSSEECEKITNSITRSSRLDLRKVITKTIAKSNAGKVSVHN